MEMGSHRTRHSDNMKQNGNFKLMPKRQYYTKMTILR